MTFKVAMRVVPRGGYAEILEVESLKEIWDMVTLHFRLMGGCDFRLKGRKIAESRALFYVERLHAPTGTLAATKPKTGHGLGMCLDTNNCVTQAGTGGQYDWLMIEPEHHPYYAAALAAHSAELRKRAIEEERQEQIQQEMQDHLQSLIDSIGYDEALRRLSNI